MDYGIIRSPPESYCNQNDWRDNEEETNTPPRVRARVLCPLTVHFKSTQTNN